MHAKLFIHNYKQFSTPSFKVPSPVAPRMPPGAPKMPAPRLRPPIFRIFPNSWPAFCMSKFHQNRTPPKTSQNSVSRSNSCEILTKRANFFDLAHIDFNRTESIHFKIRLIRCDLNRFPGDDYSKNIVTSVDTGRYSYIWLAIHCYNVNNN